MKEQMTSMIEAMMSMGRMMEDNAAAVATTSAAAKADPSHPSGINQTSRPIPDMVGQGEKCWEAQAVPILCKVRILSHHTTCHLTIHHPMQCMCPTRTPTTLFPFSLKASNPRWGMLPLRNLWERPVKSLGTTLWASSNLTLHMLLRDQRLVACLSPIPQGPLSIVCCNPYISQWGDYLLPWKKKRNLILQRKD